MCIHTPIHQRSEVKHPSIVMKIAQLLRMHTVVRIVCLVISRRNFVCSSLNPKNRLVSSGELFYLENMLCVYESFRYIQLKCLLLVACRQPEVVQNNIDVMIRLQKKEGVTNFNCGAYFRCVGL